MTRGDPGEEGYALVAAVASMVVFALVALMVIEASRGTIVAASGEIDRARAVAAAEAGAAIAIDGLLGGRVDPRSLDGRARSVDFDGARLAIRIEDEAGKVPINALDEKQTRRLLELLGLGGARLDVATDSLLDWIDQDDDPRPDGAEVEAYAAARIHPRNGGLRSVEEVALVRGFDSKLAQKLAAVATVHPGRHGFDPARASLVAIEVMGGADASVDLIQRQRVLAGQETAIAPGERTSLVGQPLTIRVTAQLSDGSRASLRELVILTGRAAQPYVVLERD